MGLDDRLHGWTGAAAVGALVAVLGFAAWTFLIEDDGAAPAGGSASSTIATPKPSPTAAVPASTPPGTEPTAAPTTYINAQPGESPPTRPSDEMSDAGLEAFVRYFVQAADWAYASMDPTLLDQASAPECGACTAVISSIRADRAAGQRYEGGRLTLTRVSINPDLSPDGTQRNAGYWWDGSQYTVYASDDTILQRDPPGQNSEYSLNARFDGGRWSVVSLFFVDRTP